MSPAEPLADTNVAATFAALGDPMRLELLTRLIDRRTRSITELSDGLPITRQGVRKHLKVLEDADVVVGRRVGREHQFALKAERVFDARAYLDRVSAQWEDAAMRLKSFVEDH